MYRRLILLPVLLLISGSLPAQRPERNGNPLARIARFLQLEESQVQEATHLLEARESELAPIREEVRNLEAQLRELLGSDGPDAGSVGALVIAIHDLQQQIQEIRRETITRFEELLGEEQLRRFRSIRRVARLAPVIGAFKNLALL